MFILLYFMRHKISIHFDPVISLLKIENNDQKPKALLMKMITATALSLKGKIGNELNLHP